MFETEDQSEAAAEGHEDESETSLCLNLSFSQTSGFSPEVLDSRASVNMRQKHYC